MSDPADVPHTILQEPAVDEQLELRCVNTIRFLAVDAVQKAKSGHPGMPMGAAPMAYVLWTRFLRFDPADPAWPDRDRFVLSAGHGSHAALRAAAPDRLRPVARRAQGASASGAAAPRATPSTASRRASRRPPARSARASPTPSGMAIAERFLAARFNRRGHRRRRPPHLRDRLRRRPDGGRLAARPPRWPATCGSGKLDRPLRRQPHHDRRAAPSWPSPRTSWRASRPTAGTCSAWPTATTWTRSTRAIAAAQAEPSGRR